MKSGTIFIMLLFLLTPPVLARTVGDDIKDRCREEVGGGNSKAYEECVETETQLFREQMTRALIKSNRATVERSFGTAHLTARLSRADFALAAADN